MTYCYVCPHRCGVDRPENMADTEGERYFGSCGCGMLTTRSRWPAPRFICGRSPVLVVAKVVAQFSLVVAICIACFAKTTILAARALARKSLSSVYKKSIRSLSLKERTILIW